MKPSKSPAAHVMVKLQREAMNKGAPTPLNSTNVAVAPVRVADSDLSGMRHTDSPILRTSTWPLV